ncbi:regulator-G-protein signaling Rgs1 [Schizosaccharomyces japonicus yFS275]|uniref:Regulator-G-protein signaling Rgs1 n=1 Tax=Schizosaccharomyces japonicus (strain yFS275 / FY16936) TaxID=402676 RepID=B6JX62_SCHJY|nr:regulator-G-protein signaling Rgs1 [Schizosaccharomyces japonicus yFS275]EEB05963.1 regulator-G-protein signaling Rgs1 [Schizosaccharomyces japonicus yFS275]
MARRSSCGLPRLFSHTVMEEPTVPRKLESKHQKSTRFMQLTYVGRPFSKDFLELFGAMIVSTPFSSHRMYFKTFENTCTLKQLLFTLENLQLNLVHRIDGDANGTGKIIKSTTKFSVPKKVAKCLCQMFLNARLITSVSDAYARKLTSEKTLLRLTRKGASVVDQFIQQNAVKDYPFPAQMLKDPLILVPINRMQDTDLVYRDETLIQTLLQRMLGNRPLLEDGLDSRRVIVYERADTSVRGQKRLQYELYGIDVMEWLMNNTMLLDWTELQDIANDFLLYGLLEHERPTSQTMVFSYHKGTSYIITASGIEVLGWHQFGKAKRIAKLIQELRKTKSNVEIVEQILKMPNLHTSFYEFALHNYCEENARFYEDTRDFQECCQVALREKDETLLRECFTQAYRIYNCYLSVNAPNRLNIPDEIYRRVVAHMARAMEDDSMAEWVEGVHILFAEVREHVTDLMAGDSLMKFLEQNESKEDE